MKPKVSLDPQAMKQFFLDHFEKVLFGLVAVGFLVFIYRAVARESLGFTPEDLAREAERAKTNVKNTQPTDVPKPEDYAAKAPRIREPIDPGKPLKDLSPPFWRAMEPRGKPEVFPLTDVRATAGQGAFQMLTTEDESAAPMMAPTAQIRGQRWVCVTALIEHAKHYESYRAVLGKAGFQDPARDFPSYGFYRIERAEVDPQDPDADPTQLTWVRLHVANALREAEERWSSMGQEVVDQRYWPANYSVMMFPLGPLVDRAWGPEVAHSPDFLAQVPEMQMDSPDAPAAKNGKSKEGDDASKAEADETKTHKKKKAPKRPIRPRPSADDPDEPDELGPRGGGYGDMSPGGYPGMPGMPGGSGSMMRTPRMSSPMPGSPGGMPPGYRRGGMPPGYPSGSPGGSMPGGYPMGSTSGPGYGYSSPDGYGGQYGEEYEPEEFLLFRFFDFNVEPGKQYRYRVRLLLDNPNQGLDPRTLAQPDLATPRWLEAPWSAPSPVVAVPLDSQVWTVKATPKLTETFANVLLVNFNMETGLEAFKKFEVARGQWLSFLKQEIEEPAGPEGMYPGMPGGMPMPGGMSMPGGSPSMPPGSPGGSAGMMPGYPGGSPDTPYGMAGPKARSKAKSKTAEGEEEKPTVDYLADCLLLDVSGGRTLPGREKVKKLTEPAALLLMDKDGKLVVRNELDDLVAVSRYEPPEETAPRGTIVSDETAPSNPYEMYMGVKPKKGAKPARRGVSGSGSPSGMPPGYPGGSSDVPGGSGSPSGMPPGYPGYPGGPPGKGRPKAPAVRGSRPT